MTVYTSFKTIPYIDYIKCDFCGRFTSPDNGYTVVNWDPAPIFDDLHKCSRCREKLGDP